MLGPLPHDGEKGQVDTRSASPMYTLQSLHSSPIRHEVDLSSSRGEGRRRKEGVLVAGGGGAGREEREAGASLVSSRGRTPLPSSP